MKTILLIACVVMASIIIVPTIMFGPRIRKDISKKRNYANTYAIQNVAVGKDIRVYDAQNEDGTPIILYDHHNWECITWQLIGIEENVFLLKNLYTQKGFQPVSTPMAGVKLHQQTLGGYPYQQWEFVSCEDSTFHIRLRGTELYLTVTSGENNSDIVLMPMQKNESQLWKLIRQNPVI